MVRSLAIILTVAFAFCGSSAIAKPAAGSAWLVFEEMAEGTIYIDPASIQRQGNRADMWVLIDYKRPQDDRTGKKIKSDKLHYRYDCAGRQFSIITSSAYAGAMGSGAVIDVNADPQFQPVPPGTTAEQMLARACAASK